MDGLLLIDKPAGPTSHDVVDRLRRLFGLERAGHAGTLDPAATGLLLVLTGRATRTAEYFEGLEKEYRFTVRLGVRTDTDDLAGETLETRPVPPLDPAAIESVLAPFRGSILQRPPAYAALKVAGRRLYDLAREGRPAVVAPREVTIRSLDVAAWRAPDLELSVRCGAGTYVRALARDLGEALGCGGAAAAIRRTAVGGFRVERALPPDALRGRPLGDVLIPLDRALAHLPRIALKPEAVEKIRHGKIVGSDDFAEAAPDGLADHAPCRLCHGEILLAIGQIIPPLPDGPPGRQVRPRKVFL